MSNKITIHQSPDRRGCLPTLIFVLLLVGYFGGSRLFRAPEFVSELLAIDQPVSDFEALERRRAAFHKQFLPIKGTVIGSYYFTIGGIYYLNDSDGNTLRIFTSEVPPRIGTQVTRLYHFQLWTDDGVNFSYLLRDAGDFYNRELESGTRHELVY